MIVAVDVETEMIAPRSKVGKGIRTSPFEIPRLVLIAMVRSDGAETITDEADEFKSFLAGVGELVFHNAAFDIPVLECFLEKSATDRLLRFVEYGRVHDTMLLEQLVGLAEGRYDMPRKVGGKWQQERMKNESLDVLAARRCGTSLTKDESIRLTFGQYMGRLGELPRRFVDYALDDARATLAVYQEQLNNLRRLGVERNEWGYLTDRIQLECSLVFGAMDRRGVHIDSVLANDLQRNFQEYLQPLRTRLVSAKLGRWKNAAAAARTRRELDPTQPTTWTHNPATGTVVRWRHFKKHSTRLEAPSAFSLDTKAIKHRLQPFATDRTPRCADGTISLNYDHWKDVVEGDEDLEAWLTHGKLLKILTTYLNVYGSVSHFYPRLNVMGAKSGRASASSTNVMNVPKSRLGIRALFVPPPGKVLVKADYTAQELYTLAECMATMGIRGPLLAALRSESDVHTAGAAFLLGKGAPSVTPEERQGQKVLHFGVPGGLGAKKLAQYARKVFGLRWTTFQARDKIRRFLEKFHDIGAYLRLISNQRGGAERRLAALHEQLGGGFSSPRRLLRFLLETEDDGRRALAEEIDRAFLCELPSGRRRRYARYTETANSYFQGLASDVSKRALWRAHCAGLDIRIFVHDEIVIATDDPDTDRHRLRDCMLAAFAELCPVVGGAAKVEVSGPLDRWGAATDMEGNVIATLPATT